MGKRELSEFKKKTVFRNGDPHIIEAQCVLNSQKKGSTPKILKASNLLIKKPMVMWSIAAAYVT